MFRVVFTEMGKKRGESGQKVNFVVKNEKLWENHSCDIEISHVIVH